MEDFEQMIEEPRIEKDWLEDVDITAITRRTEDGSYVVMKGGLPYHVPNNEEFAEFYKQLDIHAKDHPEVVTIEEPYVAPKPTEEEQRKALEAEYKRSVQHMLDEAAYARGYTGPGENISGACMSVCSYVDTGVEQFDAEGRAFRAWRSAVWAAGLVLMEEVLTGKRAMPSFEELPALLPKLETYL